MEILNKISYYLNEDSINIKGTSIDVTKPPRASNQKMVYIKTKVFDTAGKKTDSQMYIGKNGRGSIKGRYERFGTFVLGGEEDLGDIVITHDPAHSIEVSEVSVNSDGKISFTNGRHRYAGLRDQGLNKIPVVMSNESIINARKYSYI